MILRVPPRHGLMAKFSLGEKVRSVCQIKGYHLAVVESFVQTLRGHVTAWVKMNMWPSSYQ